MPRADGLPPFHSEMIEVRATTNPIGVKGAGEAGATGAPAAVIYAVLDALREVGVDDIDMPATPERVWKRIQMASGGDRATGMAPFAKFPPQTPAS
jgi:carbon-monoxide dehydrogenase large subunit